MHLQRYFPSLFHIWFHFHSLSLVSVSLLLFKLCSFLFTFPLLKYNFLNIAATILFLQFHFSPIFHDFSSLCFTPAKFSLFSLFSGKAPRNAYSGLGPEGTQWTIRRTHFMHFWKLTDNLQITFYKQCHLIYWNIGNWKTSFKVCFYQYFNKFLLLIVPVFGFGRH